MTCGPCSKTFLSWRSFKQHMVRVHQVSERNLIRRATQLGDYTDLVAIRSANGHWFLFGQGKLL